MAEISLNLLNRSNKPELIEWYKEHLKTEPDEAMSKAQLVNALAEKLGLIEGENGNNQPQQNNQSASEDRPEVEMGHDEFLTERISPETGKLEYQTNTKGAWDLLPAHKFGWKISPPKEIA